MSRKAWTWALGIRLQYYCSMNARTKGEKAIDLLILRSRTRTKRHAFTFHSCFQVYVNPYCRHREDIHRSSSSW